MQENPRKAISIIFVQYAATQQRKNPREPVQSGEPRVKGSKRSNKSIQEEVRHEPKEMPGLWV